MKKVCILIIFILCLSLFSCERELSAYEFMTELSAAYPFEGVIYHSGVEQYGEGYMSEELFRTVYVYSDEIPRDYAVFLNSRTERGAECGIFKSGNASQRQALVDMAYERIELVSPRGGSGLVMTSGEFVFYSTLPDKERAGELFRSIIK